MPFGAKVILFLFVLVIVLIAVAACRISGYWDRIEEQEEIKRTIDKEE